MSDRNNLPENTKQRKTPGISNSMHCIRNDQLNAHTPPVSYQNSIPNNTMCYQ
jgi:hypothetical protein